MCDSFDEAKIIISVLKDEVGKLSGLNEVLKELLYKQDIRIALLEQQNKLTLWIYSILFSAILISLVGLSLKVIGVN